MIELGPAQFFWAIAEDLDVSEAELEKRWMEIADEYHFLHKAVGNPGVGSEDLAAGLSHQTRTVLDSVARLRGLLEPLRPEGWVFGAALVEMNRRHPDRQADLLGSLEAYALWRCWHASHGHPSSAARDCLVRLWTSQ